jgi:hypothetical protein
MRIERIQTAQAGRGATRASATVTWEEARREPFDLYFETDAEHAENFAASPNAFLVACAAAAAHAGEERVLLEGRVCPRLRDGVTAALHLLAGWYRPGRRIPAVEATGGFVPSRQPPARAALFVSGGVDSTFSLLLNRRDYPREHPDSYADGIVLDYESFCPPGLRERAADLTRRTRASLSAMAPETGLAFLPVRANLFALADLDFFLEEAYSAALAAAAHLFESRITSASIASGAVPGAYGPGGSHPMLDPLYSSTGVEIRIPDQAYSRHEKVLRLADWAPARRSLLVCLEGPLAEGRLNCGECEKCIRTMLALEAAGRLPDFEAFPVRTISPEDVERTSLGRFTPDNFLAFWVPLASRLEEGGRPDLAEEVRRKVEQARRQQEWLDGTGWRGRLRSFDRINLGGALSRLRGAFRRRGI